MEFSGKGYEELTEEAILSKVNQFDIFNYYIPEFKALNKKFSSPFRKDGSPSCAIAEFNGKLFYKDFGTGESYTFVNFIRKKYNVSYIEALTILSNDFNLGLHSKTIEATSMGYIGQIGLPKKSVPIETIIKIKRRDWNNSIDREYWGVYGLNRAILTHFKVFPISHLWINNKYLKIKENSPSYAFVLGEGKYKILSPFSEHKWLNNCRDLIQGFQQLPERGSFLVITSSLKDCMVLYKYGYSAIAPQSENTIIPDDLIRELGERFDKIIVFFDNDAPGLEAAKVYKALYNIDYTHIPIGLPKDISDFTELYGEEEAKRVLNQLLC